MACLCRALDLVGAKGVRPSRPTPLIVPAVGLITVGPLDVIMPTGTGSAVRARADPALTLDRETAARRAIAAGPSLARLMVRRIAGRGWAVGRDRAGARPPRRGSQGSMLSLGEGTRFVRGTHSSGRRPNERRRERRCECPVAMRAFRVRPCSTTFPWGITRRPRGGIPEPRQRSRRRRPPRRLHRSCLRVCVPLAQARIRAADPCVWSSPERMPVRMPVGMPAPHRSLPRADRRGADRTGGTTAAERLRRRLVLADF